LRSSGIADVSAEAMEFLHLHLRQALQRGTHPNVASPNPAFPRHKNAAVLISLRTLTNLSPELRCVLAPNPALLVKRADVGVTDEVIGSLGERHGP
jgi:hypothetical protein